MEVYMVPISIFQIFILAFVIGFFILFLYLIPVPLWIAAWSSGAYVGLANLIGMRFRRVPPHIVVNARISAVKAGLNIAINDLEALFLAGGNVRSVTQALISADKANADLLGSMYGWDVFEEYKEKGDPSFDGLRQQIDAAGVDYEAFAE